MVRIADIMKKASGEEPERKRPGREKPEEKKPARAPAEKPPSVPQKPPPGPGAPPAAAATPGRDVLAEYQAAVEFMRKQLVQARAGSQLDPGGMKQVVLGLVKALGQDPDTLVAHIMGPYGEDYLPWHSANVAVLSLKVGLALGWNEQELLDLGASALMHDIGMSSVRENIISKEGGLSRSEMEQIREHPTKSAEILAHAKGINEVVAGVVEQEHERVDGKGYPKGLKGDDIHEYARVISAVDVYEALTHPRSYRKRYVPYEALKMLMEAGRSMLDPRVVKVMVEELSLYPVGSVVKLNTEELARVIHSNKNAIMRPVVEVTTDSAGDPLAEPRVLDLTKHPMVHISTIEREEEEEDD